MVLPGQANGGPDWRWRRGGGALLPPPSGREWCALAGAAVLVACGALCGLLLPPYAAHLLDTQFVLHTSGQLHDMWLVTPIPLALDFYLFNWTNPEELRVPGAKPRLQQLGPYRFTERFEKTRVTFNEHNNTVTYRNLKTWWFDAAGSNGSLDDRVTALDWVAVSAAYAARNHNYMMRKGLSLTLSATVDPRLYTTRTADEYLFTGYSDPLITLTTRLPAFEGIENPGWDRFAWFYKRNASEHASGTMCMATGTAPGAQPPLGELLEWNYAPDLARFWGSSNCSRVRGSTGEFFPPRLRAGRPVAMFVPEMCRVVEFDWDGEETTEQGLVGYRYVAGPRMLDNGSTYAPNACYCPGECMPSGVMNVSACRYGSPGFISLPHFYKADSHYGAQIDGLRPDGRLHDFRLVIEPRTGVPLDVVARFQVNIMTSQVDDISFTAALPRVLFPALWFEQRARAPPLYAHALRLLLGLDWWSRVGGATLAALGLALAAAVPLRRALTTRRDAAAATQRPTHREHVPLAPVDKPPRQISA